MRIFKMNIRHDMMDDVCKYDELNFLPDEDEQLAGYACPVCGYPIVLESGLEVCYCCGWSKDEEEE